MLLWARNCIDAPVLRMRDVPLHPAPRGRRRQVWGAMPAAATDTQGRRVELKPGPNHGLRLSTVRPMVKEGGNTPVAKVGEARVEGLEVIGQ
jgi:hypothetical protein